MLWSCILCTFVNTLPYAQLVIQLFPKVTLPHGGILVGDHIVTANKNIAKAFRGIPYAEPPIEELRFKSPVSAKSWTGGKIFDKDPNVCPSQNPYERNFETESELETSAPLSVMVYLHGGGFITGNGNSAKHGPERLLDNNVILVVGNYRLGALGFLSTGTSDCPGNFGMKDQVMMLKWVKENIEVFGGNPNDVTIFGESAGGASVGFQIFPPLSKGLFHKAILQSGTNFDCWALGEEITTAKRTLEHN